MHLPPLEAPLADDAVRGALLANVLPVGVSLRDAEGRCVSVNPRWCEITGLAEAEARGDGWVCALHPEDRGRVLAEWSRATREAAGFESEYRIQRPNRSVAWVLGQALPERDAGGDLTGFIGTITDLTPHIAAAIDLRAHVETRKQVEAALAARGDQLRSLALQLALAQEHERRTIAAGLHDAVGQGLALACAKLGQLAEAGAHSDVPVRAREIRALIERALGETRALTFELSSPVLHELGLGAALESLCEQLGRDHPVCFRVVIEQQPPALAENLRILLYRTARQLCSNIVRHARATRADVRLEVEGDRIRIVVSDDGIGFDATEPRFGPTGGFGLFAIRELMTQIGGSFEIESAPGRGTRAVLSARPG